MHTILLKGINYRIENLAICNQISYCLLKYNKTMILYEKSIVLTSLSKLNHKK